MRKALVVAFHLRSWPSVQPLERLWRPGIGTHAVALSQAAAYQSVQHIIGKTCFGSSLMQFSHRLRHALSASGRYRLIAFTYGGISPMVFSYH